MGSGRLAEGVEREKEAGMRRKRICNFARGAVLN
jgi:hypothetical protein